MKRTFLLMLLLAVFAFSSAQVMCVKVYEDLDRWKRLKQENVIAWATTLKDSAFYVFNQVDELEGEYVILLDSSRKVADLKDITMDFFSKKFTLTSHWKSDIKNRMELKETGTNSMYFHAVYAKASYLASGLAEHVIDIDVVFIVKFKEDKIKMTIAIPSYQYYSGTKSDVRKIGVYPPFQSYGTSRKERRDDTFFCKAYIKACECILDYTKSYCEYLNKNLGEW